MDEPNQEEQTKALVAECNTLSVTTAEAYEYAAGRRLLLKAAIDYFTDLYNPRIQEADRHHKALIADRNKFTEPVRQVYDRIGKLLAFYDSQQEAIRRQKQIEEEAKARQAAAEEKKRLLQIAREAKAKELVEEIKAAPVIPEPVVVAKETPKVEGLSYRENWVFEVTDEKAVPREYLLVDNVAIGKVVRALKDKTNIPGVRAYAERIPVQR